MPISASPKPNAKQPPPPARSRYLRPLILLIALAVLTVVLIALPASWVLRFLPPSVHAEDFSGSLWHGSAGRVVVNGQDAGAVEWRIHPGPLLSLTVSADVHWVKVGFVADGAVLVDRQGATARDLVGGGPIADLADFGIAAGWRGTTQFKFSELKLGFARDPSGANAVAANAGAAPAVSVQSVVGDLGVADLSSPRVAAGTDLGGYTLHLADGAITPDADATAELSDTGGPLDVKAVIHYSAKDHTGLLSGTIKERAQASAALRSQMENLTQMHARDAQGRIPVELEFTL